jgi:hypothetical protein
MKRSSPLLFTAVLFALPAVCSLAQSAASPTLVQPIPVAQPTATSPHGWPPALFFAKPDCPVGLLAQQGTGAGMIIAHGSKDHSSPEHPTQHLHISLANRREHPVIGITLIAHGLTATSRLTPASPSSGTITRTVHLDLALDPGDATATDLAFDAFTSVSRIDLASIDYADGSSWHAPATERCSVIPERLMLVSSR